MNDYSKNQNTDEISENLEEINHKLGSRTLAFSKGLLYGFGSVLGAGLAIILIGWFLNIIGVIPAFREQALQWREIFEQTQNSQTFIPTEEK